MNQIKDLVGSSKKELFETAWLQAVEENRPAEEMGAALEALVASGKSDFAETLAWTMLESKQAKLPPEETKAFARVAVAALPDSSELRKLATTIYEKAFASHPHMSVILKASGLAGEQSARRALRTLETCLNVEEGMYLCNRFDGQVLKAKGFSPAMGEFELADPAGRSVSFEPKNLADEWELVPDTDFRVLYQHRAAELGRLLDETPAEVLIGICLAHGGKIDANSLKDELVPKYLPSAKWSNWWSRARTAAKRCHQLSLEGRSPVSVVYYPQGRSLEEEIQPSLNVARMPLEKLAVLENYLRQAKQRKVAIKPEFVKSAIESLAQQANSFKVDRPADALAASLSVEVLASLGVDKPALEYPSAKEILATAARPVQAILHLESDSLWPAALDALVQRPDAAVQLEALLAKAPSDQIDVIVERLRALGAEQAIDQAVARTLAQPQENLAMFLWLWVGPPEGIKNVPGKIELLSKLLSLVQALDHDWQIDNAERKASRLKVRAALASNNYASYRKAISEMSEAVASTFKDRINRCVGLAEAVHDDMLNILRENHYGLFIRAKVETWLDATTLWTSEQALNKRQALLKDIIEVKMLENARAIGEAAEHGDLSENSEWKFAIEERDLLQARAAKLQEEIGMARIIQPEDVPTESVGIGSKVTLERTTDAKVLDLTFMGPWDTDLDKNVYSYQTGLGQELMSKGVGDLVEVKFEGMEGAYRVTALGSGVAPREQH